MEEKKTLYDLKVDEADLITQDMILYTIKFEIEHKSDHSNNIVVNPLSLEL